MMQKPQGRGKFFVQIPGGARGWLWQKMIAALVKAITYSKSIEDAEDAYAQMNHELTNCDEFLEYLEQQRVLVQSIFT